jgi:SAM-dependent methyltransferase
MDAAAYDRWYETPRGRWIGEREAGLLRAALRAGPGDSVLDVGCGTGYFSRALSGAALRVTGVDLAPAWVAYAARRDPGGARYAVADARRLPFPDAGFDHAISVTALCFVAEERAAVAELVRVARRRVAVGLLNRRSLLWRREGLGGGSGGYRGARWHTAREARGLFQGLPVEEIEIRSAIQLPGGGWWSRIVERLVSRRLPFGAFLLATASRVSPDASGVAALRNAAPENEEVIWKA